MTLPDWCRTLLDHARAEAKRHGNPSVEPVHVAAAVLREEHQQYTSALGDSPEEHVGRLLQQLPTDPSAGISDSPAVIAMLSRMAVNVSRYDAIVTEIRELLSEGKIPPTDSADATPSVTNKDKQHSATDRAETTRLPYALAEVGSVVEGSEMIVGRDVEVDALLQVLSRRASKTPCLQGRPGIGRTSVLSALAARLTSPGYSGAFSTSPVVRIRAESVIGLRRSLTLREAFASAVPGTILALDDLEVLGGLSGNYPDLDMLGVVLSGANSERVHVVVIIDSAAVGRLSMHSPELAEALHPVQLRDLSQFELRQVSSQAAADLGAFHSVVIDEEACEAAASDPDPTPERAHPGLLVDRLDAACARAALSGRKRVSAQDIDVGSSDPPVAVERRTLEDNLRQRIVGQDEAIARIASRLALTRAKLDLRPERPDGVFLLVGPTGVGKTALARAIANELYGNQDALIRLDMSEYAQEWAIARLIGPQPGYAGYTEPEGWLTTRVRQRPDCVLLLDEIEKSHPAVWNAFLQVFDAGKLTDARGVVATFSDTVVIMTSNLGSRLFDRSPVGFGPGSSSVISEEVLSSVQQVLPLELFNRLDEVLVFAPLSRDAIREIAELEISALTARLSSSGYDLEIDNATVSLIAELGYDPLFGARHLHRNVERLLLEPLASVPGRRLRTIVDGQSIRWELTSADA